MVAREMLNQMPESSRSVNLTKYLLFKVAILDRDVSLGKLTGLL